MCNKDQVCNTLCQIILISGDKLDFVSLIPIQKKKMKARRNTKKRFVHEPIINGE